MDRQLKKLDRLIGFVHAPLWVFLFPLRVWNKFWGSKNTVSVIKLAAMGDLICLYPSLFALKKKGFEVNLITTKRSNPKIFENHSAISKIIILDTNLKLIVFSFSNIVRAISNSEFCINADQYYNSSKIFSYLNWKSVGFKTEANTQYSRYKVRYSYRDNEKKQFQNLAKVIEPTIKSRGFNSDLFSGVPDPECHNELSGTILLYPGSGNVAQMRRWPIERWVALYTKISLLGERCTFIGGPDELPLVGSLVQAGIPIKDVCINKYDLIELIEKMKKSKAFIGNDAGLFHIADGLKIPVVGLFGPNIASKWGSVREAAAHIEIQLQCRPCIITVDGVVPEYCKYGHSYCMAAIDENNVVASLKPLISQDKQL